MSVSKEKRDKRKKDTHEVFTPPELTERMLEKFSPDSWDEDKTFLDPAAGNGNLLIEVFRWKIEKGHNPTKALSTIYGVELMPDNVAEMKLRLYKQAKEYGVDGKTAQAILQKNIICHDALTYHFEFDDVFIEAKHTQHGKITHFRDSNNKWWTVEEIKQSIEEGGHFNCKGADIVIEGNHLKTKKNDTEEDNLSKLPNEEI